MKIRAALILLLILICICRIANANGVPLFILDAAIDSEEISAAKQELLIKKQSINTINTDYYPDISANITGGWLRDNSTTSASVPKSIEITNPQTYSLSIDQEIWSGGQTNLATKIAQLEYKSEKYKYLDKVQEKIIELIQLIGEIIRLEQTLYYIEKNINVLNYNLNSSKIRFKLGEISETDVYKSESRISSVKADKIKTEYELSTALKRYENEFKEKYIQTIMLQPLNVKPFNESTMIENNYELLSARISEKALILKYTKQAKTNWPTLTASAELKQSHEQINESSESTELSALLKLKIPLYDGGKNVSKVREISLQINKAKRTYKFTVNQKYQDFISAHGEYRSVLQRANAIKEEIKFSDIALNSTKKEVEVGTKSIIDMLDSEKELLDARLKLLNEEEKIILETYRINSLAGSLFDKNFEIKALSHN